MILSPVNQIIRIRKKLQVPDTIVLVNKEPKETSVKTLRSASSREGKTIRSSRHINESKEKIKKMTREQNTSSVGEEEEIQKINSRQDLDEAKEELKEESQAIEAFFEERSIEEKKQEGKKRVKTMKVESRKVKRIARIQSKYHYTVTMVEV